MSDSYSTQGAPDPAALAASLAGVAVEPDNVPTRFLTLVAGALTVVVIGGVLLAIALFNHEKAAQFEAKGYGNIDQAPHAMPAPAAPAQAQ